VAEQSDVIIGSSKEFDLTKGTMINVKNEQDIANYYFSKSAKLVIVKHGAKGSIAYTSDGDAYKVDIFPITFLKSFGGGDAYISSLFYGLFNNKSLEESLTFATAAAANAVSAHSCSDSMLTSEKLKVLIKKYNAKLPVVKKL
jgi:5-dehydro-2-deoxygluconokinase